MGFLRLPCFEAGGQWGWGWPMASLCSILDKDPPPFLSVPFLKSMFSGILRLPCFEAGGRWGWDCPWWRPGGGRSGRQGRAPAGPRRQPGGGPPPAPSPARWPPATSGPAPYPPEPGLYQCTATVYKVLAQNKHIYVLYITVYSRWRGGGGGLIRPQHSRTITK